MQMALKLAKRGISSVEPNPAVGAVIVKKDRIIGRGWHREFGGPHAEINALGDCKKRSANLRRATMYVTLEPCCHQGKTAPCTDAIIAAKLTKVVVAIIDPSKHANGKGIRKLRDAGIQAQTGVCQAEAKLLNAPFIKFATTGKCWTILKWAQTIDGQLAWADKTQRTKWISNELSRKDAHKLRRRVQGILVGIGTVLADDPLLTARPSRGRQPARIVLDTDLKVPLDCQLLNTAKESPVIIVTSRKAINTKPKKAEKISKKSAELLTVPTRQGRCDIASLLDKLSKRGIAQLLVEGGPKVITSFLKQRLADEVCVYIAPKILAAKGSANISKPMTELTQSIGLHYVDIKRFGDDVRLTGITAANV